MKTLTYILCLLVVATAASAATVTVTCTPINNFQNGIGQATTTCPDAFAAGVPTSFSTLTSATLTDITDWQLGGSSTQNTVVMTFLASGSWSPNPQTNVDSAFGVSSGGAVINTQNYTGLLTLNTTSFTVTITSSVSAGSVNNSAGRVDISYNYNYNPPATTPEPTAMCLIGLGMLGLGIPALRRKIR